MHVETVTAIACTRANVNQTQLKRCVAKLGARGARTFGPATFARNCYRVTGNLDDVYCIAIDSPRRAPVHRTSVDLKPLEAPRGMARVVKENEREHFSDFNSDLRLCRGDALQQYTKTVSNKNNGPPPSFRLLLLFCLSFSSSSSSAKKAVAMKVA